MHLEALCFWVVHSVHLSGVIIDSNYNLFSTYFYEEVPSMIITCLYVMAILALTH